MWLTRGVEQATHNKVIIETTRATKEGGDEPKGLSKLPWMSQHGHKKKRVRYVMGYLGLGILY